MQTRVKKLLWGGGAVGALSALMAAQRVHHGDGARSEGDGARAEPDVEGLQAANGRFYAALGRLLEGDPREMEQVWSHSGDATLMGPFGGRWEGWPAIREAYERAAEWFQGGEVHTKDALLRTDGGLGYVLCTESGWITTPAGRRVKVDHRATNIFRREHGEWRILHQHTDPAPRLQKARREAESE